MEYCLVCFDAQFGMWLPKAVYHSCLWLFMLLSNLQFYAPLTILSTILYRYQFDDIKKRDLP